MVTPDWLEPSDAARRVLDAVETLPSVEMPIVESVGRVLAADVVARIDIPRWTNSAMDGFAIRAGDVAAATSATPVTLRISDDIPAGSFPRGPLEPGTAARIMTGAPVPAGADSVIRVEHTDGGRRDGSDAGSVTIHDRQDAGRNLRRAGEDIRSGSIALPAGTLISPAAVGVAASLGYATVPVIRPPKVALLTSGDELVEVDRFDEVLAGRRIVSSNSYTLAAQLRQAGCEVKYLGIAADTPEALRTAVEQARGCDALVTSAGISVGEHDHVKRVLADLDTTIDFWRVRIRPGSPFAFGRIGALGGIPWFGLPGNPVSSMVTFEIFVRPALLRMAGYAAVYPAPIMVRLAEPIEPQERLTQFVRVRLEMDETVGWVARTTGPQGSGILTSVSRADALAIIAALGKEGCDGERVRALPLDPTGRLLVEAPYY